MNETYLRRSVDPLARAKLRSDTWNGPKADPGGKVIVAIALNKTYELFHHDFVQFGKQHSLYIEILSFIVLGLDSIATSVSMCFACHFKITWDFAILVFFCVFLVCH